MRTLALPIACLACFALGVSRASAQQQAVAVQLPTFSFFSVNTSVVVPDSGAGIRAAMAREAAQRLKHAGSQAACPPSLVPAIPQTETERFSQELAAARRSSAGRGAASVAALRAARENGKPQDRERAAAFLAKAAQAEADGKPEVAKIYQRMAARLSGATPAPESRVARATEGANP